MGYSILQQRLPIRKVEVCRFWTIFAELFRSAGHALTNWRDKDGRDLHEFQSSSIVLYSLFVFFERKRAFRMLNGAFDRDFEFGRVGCCGMLISVSWWDQFAELMKDGPCVQRVLTKPYIEKILSVEVE